MIIDLDFDETQTFHNPRAPEMLKVLKVRCFRHLSVLGEAMLHVLGGEAWIHEATEPAEKLLLAFCCAVPAALQTRETKANKQ